jgi:glycosyltransferase involved in cell wall biosynthesis
MSRLISIALCTYNGERFLGEQLESLVRQSRPPDELIVCDDRSTDGTVALLEHFAETAPFPVKITVNGEGLGPTANFGKTAGMCSGDIVLFCDQDDVWHENKIELEIAAMIEAEREAGADIPVLVHGDLEIVDENLVPLYPSFMRLVHPKFRYFDMPYILEDNVAVGCTTAVNRALLEIALPLPRQALMHDWWFALNATTCGKIVFIDEALVLYRQHGSNQIVASTWLSRLGTALRSPWSRWRNSLSSLRATAEQAKVLDARLAGGACRDSRKKDSLSAYAGLLEAGTAKKISVVLRHGYGRSGRLGILWFLLKAIFA